MALKKDKQKVLGEVFDEARVKSFLNVPARPDVNQDYDILEKAYRGMKAENFETFVNFFKEEGRDLNAKNPAGQTFLQVISEHKLAADYIDILKSVGAKY